MNNVNQPKIGRYIQQKEGYKAYYRLFDEVFKEKRQKNIYAKNY